MTSVDLNADLGEGAGADEAVLAYVTSTNIACGAHAGGPIEMQQAVRAAVEHGVAIGAHPGLPDRANFGRVARSISEGEAFELVTLQIEALQDIVRAESSATLVHVKPHGALYNMAATDSLLAGAIARAVHTADPGLILVGLSGSEMIRAGREVGLTTASEVFADRTYQPDGALTPRSRADALINDRVRAVEQAVSMVRSGTVHATDGSTVRVTAETICLHGDGVHAAAFARAIREGLEAAGITVTSRRRS